MATIILLMLSDLCAMSRKLLLVFMYRSLEAAPEKAFETMARTQLPQLLLRWSSIIFLVGAFVMICFGMKKSQEKGIIDSGACCR